MKQNRTRATFCEHGIGKIIFSRYPNLKTEFPNFTNKTCISPWITSHLHFLTKAFTALKIFDNRKPCNFSYNFSRHHRQ